MSDGSMKDNLVDSICSAEQLFHRLVLLVGEIGAGKTTVLRSLADQFDQMTINVNQRLALGLLEIKGKNRAIHLSEIMEKLIGDSHGPLFLDNTELLFDKSLHQDPLKLLQSLSRNKTIVVTWSGRFVNDTLSYAEPSHSEYRKYYKPDALIEVVQQN